MRGWIGFYIQMCGSTGFLKASKCTPSIDLCDQFPIVLGTNPFKWGSTPFRIENMWLLHPNFKERFSFCWSESLVNEWEGHKLMKKLQFIKSKLKEWNKVSFRDLREKKKNILTNIVNIDVSE